MTDDSIPPVPPAERVFKVPTYGQESKKLAGDVIKNQVAPAGKSAKGSFFENFRQLLTKGIPLPGKNPGGAPDNKTPQSLFASPIHFQGMDSVKQLLTSGIDLDVVNKVLTASLVLLIGYTITVAVYKRSGIDKLMRSISHIRFEKSTSQAIEAYQPVDYYTGQVRGRDIFNPGGEVKPQAMPEAPLPEPPKPKLKEMVKDLSVVGIAWGEAPKAMIQNAATQEIYFLKKDDMIGKTEIKVKDILRGKVVISYGDEEMEF